MERIYCVKMDKQKVLKNVIFIGLILLADFMLAQLHVDGDMLPFYDGVAYGASMYFYMLQFFVFACYSLYMHSEFENFLYGAGVYRLVREGRKKLFWRLNARLVALFIGISFAQLAGYGMIKLLLAKQLYLIDRISFLHICIVNLLAYYFVFFLQMILELWFSGRIAMYLVMLYYLFSLFAGDNLHLLGNRLSSLQFLFLPNITMRLRWEKMCSSFWMTGIEFVFLVGIIIAGLFVGCKLFQQKDIV